MTIRELRQALTQIDNQEMTVAQLRRLLYDQDDQDQPVEQMTLAAIEYAEKRRTALPASAMETGSIEDMLG